ncbi:MAG: response regulator transcription factor [Chitinophagales bacterium]
MKNPLRIIIADDHTLVRKGLVSILEEMQIAQSLTEAANGKEVMDLLGASPQLPDYDLVLMDVEMPVMDGITASSKIKQEYPSVNVLMLTMMNNPATIRQCIASGAKGFVYKNASEIELAEAIQKVMSGQLYLSEEASRTLLKQEEVFVPDKIRQLSTREVEILKLVAIGYSSTVIGEKLFISPSTVDTHRKNILKKLGLTGIPALTKFALQHKLIE